MQGLLLITFLVNVIVAGVWALSVFVIIERRPKLSIPFGVGVGFPYIGLLYWYGETQLMVTVDEMKWLIIAAVVGAIIGIGTVVAIFKPHSD